jgi:spore coat polysaccharide biosynthesis protein SpsF
MAGTPILIRCDASPSLGYGHLVRCLALAQALHKASGDRPVFMLADDDAASVRVQAAGYAVERPRRVSAEAWSEARWLEEVVSRSGARVLILDIRTDLAAADLLALRAGGVKIALIDDTSPRRLAADLVFLPPVPQVDRLSWDGAVGECLVGWDWIILRPEFAAPVPVRLAVDSGRPLRVLVTMGGSDPAGLTLRALRELDEVAEALTVAVVIGGAFKHEKELGDWLKRARGVYTLHRDVSDMVPLMRAADLAVASFGMTAYEFASQGVPGIYFGLNSDHAEAAQALVATDLATSLGVYDQVPTQALAVAVADWAIRLRAGYFVVQRRIDGDGARRIVHKILTPAGAHVAHH